LLTARKKLPIVRPGQSRTIGPFNREQSYVPPLNSLQYRLVQIWEDLLTLDGIGVQDDFFALGGSPMLADKMFGVTESATGETLSENERESLLAGSLTVHSLSQLLLRRIPGMPWFKVITSGDRHKQPPFFYFHGDFSGGGFYAVELAKTLSSRQPFAIIQPHGYNGDAIPATIEEMAADYADKIQVMYAEGPYILGGLCNGGLVAFEIARRLRSRDQEVPCVILLDTICNQGMGVEYPTPRRPPDGWQNNPRTRGIWLFNSYRSPFARYHPGPYDGPVALLYSNDRGFWGGDPRESIRCQGWRDVASQTRMTPMPGDHISCIGCYANEVASAMGMLLTG
jgi:hypothetical protein